MLRCAILKQYRELTCEELSFHLEDSDAFRSFARLEMGQYPSKSVLQENIKGITEETWEAIHPDVLEYAARENIEKGRTIRVDATAKRKKPYRDLLHYAHLVKGYAEPAIPEFTGYEGHTLEDTFTGREPARRLMRTIPILDKVIDQTERRVFKAESIPASEKIVSFFEDHTDIIVRSHSAHCMCSSA